MFSLLKNVFRQDTNEQIRDERKAQCPYCSSALKKIPGSKTKCPHCGQYIHVRTKMKDRVRVVVTKQEADKIDEEWSNYEGQGGGIAEWGGKEYDAQRKILHKRFGKEPSDQDVAWGVLNARLIKYAQNQNWEEYRFNRMDMGEELESRSSLKHALDTYLEVFYLDLNGPQDISNLVKDNTIKKDSFYTEYLKPFNPEQSGLVTPHVVEKIKSISNKLHLDNDLIHDRFIEHNKTIHKSLKLPLAPKECWLKLKNEISK